MIFRAIRDIVIRHDTEKLNIDIPLIPEIINQFIDKIMIHDFHKVDDKYERKIDIYYNSIGIIGFPTTPEEM